MEILTRMLQELARCSPRRVLAIMAMLSIVLVPAKTFITAAAADESLESAVKAAFLFKFGAYVEWPASAFISPTSPMHLCVVGGSDAFIATLGKVVGTERINDRTVVVRSLKTVDRDSGCHILYIGVAEAQHVGQIIETTRGSNVLTVSDAGGSKSGAGIIDFVIANNRVRFDIDDEAAAQNGLVVSSKLLSLALNVKRRTSQGAR